MLSLLSVDEWRAAVVGDVTVLLHVLRIYLELRPSVEDFRSAVVPLLIAHMDDFDNRSRSRSRNMWLRFKHYELCRYNEWPKKFGAFDAYRAATKALFCNLAVVRYLSP